MPPGASSPSSSSPSSSSSWKTVGLSTKSSCTVQHPSSGGRLCCSSLTHQELLGRALGGEDLDELLTQRAARHRSLIDRRLAHQPHRMSFVHRTHRRRSRRREEVVELHAEDEAAVVLARGSGAIMPRPAGVRKLYKRTLGLGFC